MPAVVIAVNFTIEEIRGRLCILAGGHMTNTRCLFLRLKYFLTPIKPARRNSPLFREILLLQRRLPILYCSFSFLLGFLDMILQGLT